jgi:hypothetical protein
MHPFISAFLNQNPANQELQTAIKAWSITIDVERGLQKNNSKRSKLSS